MFSSQLPCVDNERDNATSERSDGQDLFHPQNRGTKFKKGFVGGTAPALNVSESKNQTHLVRGAVGPRVLSGSLVLVRHPVAIVLGLAGVSELSLPVHLVVLPFARVGVAALGVGSLPVPHAPGRRLRLGLLSGLLRVLIRYDPLLVVAVVRPAVGKEELAVPGDLLREQREQARTLVSELDKRRRGFAGF